MAYEEQETGRLPGRHGNSRVPTPQAGPMARAMQTSTYVEPTPARRLGFVRELAETVLLTLVIFVAVRTLVVNFRVDGDSMVPTLHNGQYLLVNKAVYFHLDLNALKNVLPGPDTPEQDVVYLFHPPERGDIIVLNPPVRSDKPYIKRVVALPGDRLKIDRGKAVVDGRPLGEPYATLENCGADVCTFRGSIVIPEDHYFVMGDNRGASDDSRFWGPVPRDQIIGRVDDCLPLGLRCTEDDRTG